jgi:hypothetical protein
MLQNGQLRNSAQHPIIPSLTSALAAALRING